MTALLVPFSDATYNKLRTIEDAHAVIKSSDKAWKLFRDDFGALLEVHGLEKLVHVRILHKHFALDRPNQVMCESFEEKFANEDGTEEPAVVTSLHPLDDTLWAESWMVVDGHLAPFEFTTDDLVRTVGEKLMAMNQFWNDAIRIIETHGLESIVAIGVMPRSHNLWDPSSPSEGFPIESSYRHASRGPIHVVKAELGKGDALYSELNWGGLKACKCIESGDKTQHADR